MKISHHVKQEASGLYSTTLELANWEMKAGHEMELREPAAKNPYFGDLKGKPDIHCIHSQLNSTAYHDNIPKMMWMHGEPLSSVANGVSMKAIVDLAPSCDAFIAMRKKEMPIWSSIKRTYLVRKGIDLNVFRPLTAVDSSSNIEKLAGNPAILYVENWRQQRNPLYLCVAMIEVLKKFPEAKLHLFNCQDKKMHETFLRLREHNKWWTFIRSLTGPVDGKEATNELYNRADIVVSCLYPLYARSIEAFGAGKAFISPGYNEHDDYPWQCELDPISMARAITACWENYDKINYRQWALDKHNVKDTVDESIKIYERYL